jgi:excisionase family DNA binding protein
MTALHTMAEAAAILRIDRGTLRRYLEAGQIAATKLGKTWRFRADEIERVAREGFQCVSINGQMAKSGGVISPQTAHVIAFPQGSVAKRSPAKSPKTGTPLPSWESHLAQHKQAGKRHKR